MEEEEKDEKDVEDAKKTIEESVRRDLNETFVKATASTTTTTTTTAADNKDETSSICEDFEKTPTRATRTAKERTTKFEANNDEDKIVKSRLAAKKLVEEEERKEARKERRAKEEKRRQDALDQLLGGSSDDDDDDVVDEAKRKRKQTSDRILADDVIKTVNRENKGERKEQLRKSNSASDLESVATYVVDRCAFVMRGDDTEFKSS